MKTPLSLIGGKKIVLAIYYSIHDKDFSCANYKVHIRKLNRSKEALNAYAKYRHIKLSSLSLKALFNIAREYQSNALEAIHTYFQGRQTIRNIANDNYLSKYSILRLLSNETAISLYNYKFHKHIHVGQHKNPITYNRKLKYFGGDNTAIQSPLLCKYYEQALSSMEHMIVMYLDNPLYCINPTDNEGFGTLYTCLPWIIYFCLDDEGWYGPTEANKGMSLSKEDLWAGSESLLNNSEEACNHECTSILNWLTKYLFISHPRLGESRIIYYRNPMFKTLHDINKENRKLDRNYRKHYGNYKYARMILKIKEVGLSNKYHTMIAAFSGKESENPL